MHIPENWIAHIYRVADASLPQVFESPNWMVDICSPERHTRIEAGVRETRVRSWNVRFHDKIPVTWHVTDVEPYVILFQ